MGNLHPSQFYTSLKTAVCYAGAVHPKKLRTVNDFCLGRQIIPSARFTSKELLWLLSFEIFVWSLYILCLLFCGTLLYFIVTSKFYSFVLNFSCSLFLSFTLCTFFLSLYFNYLSLLSEFSFAILRC